MNLFRIGLVLDAKMVLLIFVSCAMNHVQFEHTFGSQTDLVTRLTLGANCIYSDIGPQPHFPLAFFSLSTHNDNERYQYMQDRRRVI